MTFRPRLRRPDQPFVVRCLLGVYEFVASVRLAVVVIAVMVVILVMATLVDRNYGTSSRVSNFAVYETWWFALANAVLGLNVLCAALIRFPWKKSQIPFLITHAGILLLLWGAWISRQGGIDANLPVLESRSDWRAFKQSQHFQLTVFPESDPGAATGVMTPQSKVSTITIRFAAGPFNWADYEHLSWFPWHWAQRDRGVLYDRDGIRLEVLDYYADAEQVSVPRLTVVARGKGASDDRAPSDLDQVTLAIEAPSQQMAFRPYGSSSTKTLPRGQRVTFWMTGDAGETEAFAKTLPEGRLGPQGQLVVYHAGKVYRFNVADMAAGKPLALGDSGLAVELNEVLSGMAALKLQVRRGNDDAGRMLLFASTPWHNRHDYANKVYAEYWLDPAAAKTADEKDQRVQRELAAPRIDLMQGSDQKLYCRAWQAPQAEPAVELKADSPSLMLWSKRADETALQLKQFRPSPKAGTLIEPVEFRRKKSADRKQRYAKVQLTVDGNAQEFLLQGVYDAPAEEPLPAENRRIVAGEGRRVAVTLANDRVDIGFQVYLHRFVRKLDPGSGAESHFASLVDFRDREDPDAKLRKDVLITMNEPANFSDPATRRSFRFYQESYRLSTPGDPQFEHFVGGLDPRDHLYQSNLTVNYDPGRGWKYVGCLMITLGSLLLFYMKRRFFVKRVIKPSSDAPH